MESATMSDKINFRRSTEHQRQVMEIRRSSAASKHKSVKDYRRKPKHVGRGWQ